VIGDLDDFRSKAFRQVPRFPGIMTRGNPFARQSAYMPSFSYPSWGPSQPFPMFAGTGGFPLAFFPQFGGPGLHPWPGGAGGGSSESTTGTITVVDVNDTVTISDVDTIEFEGDLDVTDLGGGTVNVNVTAAGSGTTIAWGRVTAITKNASEAIWEYTVQPYVNGSANGGTISVWSCLEEANTNTVAYGMTVDSGAGGDQISSTEYYVREIPVGTMIPYVSTDDIDGVTSYWTWAPFIVKGSCT